MDSRKDLNPPAAPRRGVRALGLRRFGWRSWLCLELVVESEGVPDEVVLAVHDLEAGQVEGGAETPIRLGVEVAATHQHALPCFLRRMLREAERADQSLHPLRGMVGETVSVGVVELPETGIDVVELDEQRAFH